MNPNRPKILTVVSLELLALLTLCARARSQEAPVASDYTHYRLVFLPGTFGGADNHFLVGGAHILNNRQHPSSCVSTQVDRRPRKKRSEFRQSSVGRLLSRSE